MSQTARPPRLSIRLYFADDAMLGPGKAELLERIVAKGSISAAGRDMGMSYKRAWMLVETLNGMFHGPLVESARGGPGGGGASLTDLGHDVLALYRSFESAAQQAGADQIARLMALRRPKG